MPESRNHIQTTKSGLKIRRSLWAALCSVSANHMEPGRHSQVVLWTQTRGRSLSEEQE